MKAHLNKIVESFQQSDFTERWIMDVAESDAKALIAVFWIGGGDYHQAAYADALADAQLVKNPRGYLSKRCPFLIERHALAGLRKMGEGGQLFPDDSPASESSGASIHSDMAAIAF
jgi:hypothetical protein